MSEEDVAKEFVKSWARLTVGLHTCQAAALKELQSETTVYQQAQTLIQESLGSFQERRVLALQIALALQRSK